VATPVTQTPNLNIPIGGLSAIVLVGVVNSRVNQLDMSADCSGGSMIEMLKKQKRSNTQNARSAATVSDSPRRAQ
jgi:preprotein translocase subunit SecF